MLTQCRLRPAFDTTSPYKGETVTYDILTESEALRAKVKGDIYDECVLWYFQFRCKKDPEDRISHYLGVMDIDIYRDEGMDDEAYKTKISSYLYYLKGKLFEMGYHCYRIYLSGTKGYHVYLFDTKLWVIPETTDKATHNLWLEAQISRLYPLLYEDLDMNIYHLNKGIRNPLYPHPKTKRASRMIYEQNCPSCFWDWFMDIIHTQVPESVKFDPSHLPNRTNQSTVRPPQQTLKSFYSGGSTKDELSQIFKGARIYQKTGSLYLVDGKYCPIKQGEHKEKGKSFISYYGDYAIVKCHHAKCYSKSILVQKKEQPLTDFKGLLDNLNEKGEIKETVKDSRYINSSNQKHISTTDIDWVLEEGYGIVSSAMGTGKTTSVIQWIEEKRAKEAKRRQDEGKEKKPFKVLLLVTRITQACNFSNKYPGMKSYLDVEGSISSNESSVLCVNSLMRSLPNGMAGITRFDLLILDEIESIIEALISSVISSGKSKQCSIWQLFKCLIIGSKRVLFMDGILTERTAKFLERLKILSFCRLVQHDAQPDYRTYVNFRSDVVFEDEFVKDIVARKKVCIVSNSKSILYTYAKKAEIIANSNHLVITGDSDDKDKMTSSNPNMEWTRDILAFNTAVGPGASYDEIHFDLMYVICSPLSCTPFSLYQMINRIRTLKEKKANILILYNEYKIYPSKQDLKRSKSENIVKMHQKQNDFGFPLSFHEKIGNDYIKLDVNATDNSVLRKLIKEEKLVLYYEDNDFVDTLVDFEHEKLKLNDTEYYACILFEIIKRNGGTVMGFVDYKNASDKTKKFLKDSTRVVRKEGKENYKNLGLLSDNVLTKKIPGTVDPLFRTSMNRYVQFNDTDTQIRWSRFRRIITKTEASVYEKELEDINTHRKAINNTLIYSTGLLESLKQVCEICGFRINTALGTIEGKGSYERFTDKHNQIETLLKEINKQIYNSSKKELPLKKLKSTRMPKDTDTFKNISMIFQYFGINITLDVGKSSRKKVPNREERFWNKTFEVCMFTQHIRMAFIGLAYDTGLQIEDAFGHLQLKYKKF